MNSEIIRETQARNRARRRLHRRIEDWLGTLTIAVLTLSVIGTCFGVLWVLWSLGVWLQS